MVSSLYKVIFSDLRRGLTQILFLPYLEVIFMPCSTPVVLLIFRRPDLTALVFEAIRQAQPSKLLIVADGPRNKDEVELCQQARAATDNVDWDCEVLRNYSGTNMGCRNRVSSGLTWAFEQVEEAIILEDDCLPHQSFFLYCETLLKHYRHDQRIMVVSGSNYQDGQKRTPYSYYFSKYNHCWGWATWRRAWKHWELNPQKWLEFRNDGFMQSICDNSHEEKYWTEIFNTLFLEGKPNTWDYPWTFACWANNGLTVLPNVNLVSNLGFGEGATHTGGDSNLAKMSVEEILSISHPPFVVQHKAADYYTFRHVFGGTYRKRWRKKLTKVRSDLSRFSRKLFSKYV
ncbi:glycosyltransferase family 2 protein [Leptolyngbya sp. CCNP1308]|uniref:glycosyltransferase family 2 protein n=1 Tax=Leptolyngbya sp. CCNP1308 TaxID=3110255 RepID=UPI002B2217BE|nr:glycosyltransferase family 2 protein [Leptolyngbya sp. CCNP1308]MEA5452266.1 glycosyltransferase family 2 protein [Leptolyngbya sp. CCNP1308]